MPGPEFPTAAVVGRTLELGCGSGPWSRRDLVERWGDSVANKFIDDAKNAGWLVAPLANTFHVPPARDLMIVNWLTGRAREEFVLSRALAAAGFRSWCFSAWADTVGIETGRALLVTDLGPLPPLSQRRPKTAPAPRPRDIIERNRSLLQRLGTLPFLENVILAPFLPQSDRRGEAAETSLGAGKVTNVADPNWILGAPNEPSYPAVLGPIALDSPARDARRIRYPLTPAVDDVAWVVALAAALGMPRLDERIRDVFLREAKREPLALQAVRPPFLSRVRAWATMMGAPEPNSGWRTVFQSGRSQYLLLPPSLWKEAVGQSNAQRFQVLGTLGERR